MIPDLHRPGLAAITLSAHGGGIAAMSRLTHRALGDMSGRHVPVLTLARDGLGRRTGTAARMAFGARLTFAQLAGHCDWVLFTHLSLATAQSRVPARVRRPYAVFLHDVEAWTPLSPFRQRVLADAFLRLANSHYTARRVMEANPGCGAVEACPLALSVDENADVASHDSQPIDVGPRAVLIVGRMVASERYKGHDELLDVWPQVVAAVPDARLVCVGEGDDAARLQAKAAALGVARYVIFPGFVDEPTKRVMYERAAVFAMPSRREGFGLVYLEAMAARLPCIGSVHDAAGEIIVDGQTGYLVSQDDGPTLAARLIQLLGDAALRARMGEAGRARGRRDFSYDAFRARLAGYLSAATSPDIQKEPAATPAGIA